MAVIVVAVACAAPYFRGGAVHQRHYGVVSEAAALHAKIVDDVAKPHIFHLDVVSI